MAKDSAGMSILCLVDANAPGIGIVPQTNLADMPLFLLTFTTAPVASVLAKGEEAEAAWARGIDEVLVATAALAAGGAGRILDLTLAYARERKQFGQAIGGFQSIAHYLADAAVQVAGARTVTYRAAAEADRGVDDRYFALMAKAKACAVYCDVSALAIQIFGGMGFTMEADPQLFYRRAKHLALMNGAPDWLEDGVAELLFDETKRIYS
jgi:alkylation response protein AidB-like acyl-CoA dehydrogenase